MTAVDFLAERYNYITWMRNRDEISAGLADEWRKDYLEQAKQMEKEQIIEAYKRESAFMKHVGCTDEMIDKSSIKYYNETYGK